MRAAASAALSLVLAACGGAERAAAPAETAAPPRSASGEISAQKPQAGKAILDANGVALGRTGATATRFAFGAPRAEVDRSATAALGAAPRTDVNAECGAGPMEFSTFGGLRLNYLDGKLVGWFAEADPRIATSDSIRPGGRMRDLQVVRSAEFVEGSTLDGEFAYVAADGNTIGGFATSGDRDAMVESLYAGVNCFFR